MVEARTGRPPRYLDGVATLEISKRSSLCHSHASWFRAFARLPPSHPYRCLLSLFLIRLIGGLFRAITGVSQEFSLYRINVPIRRCTGSSALGTSKPHGTSRS